MARLVRPIYRTVLDYKQSWAFTVKDNRKDKGDLYEGYKLLFNQWESIGWVLKLRAPERDAKGREHYHGVVHIPMRAYRKAGMRYGFHVKLVKIITRDQMRGWCNYCLKDQDIQTNIEEPSPELRGNIMKMCPNRNISNFSIRSVYPTSSEINHVSTRTLKPSTSIRVESGRLRMLCGEDFFQEAPVLF